MRKYLDSQKHARSPHFQVLDMIFLNVSVYFAYIPAKNRNSHIIIYRALTNNFAKSLPHSMLGPTATDYTPPSHTHTPAVQNRIHFHNQNHHIPTTKALLSRAVPIMTCAQHIPHYLAKERKNKKKNGSLRRT